MPLSQVGEFIARLAAESLIPTGFAALKCGPLRNYQELVLTPSLCHQQLTEGFVFFVGARARCRGGLCLFTDRLGGRRS